MVASLSPSFPGCVMVALQILVLFVGVRILPGEYADGSQGPESLSNMEFRLAKLRVDDGDSSESSSSTGPFVYRLGHEILNLKRRVRFP